MKQILKRWMFILSIYFTNIYFWILMGFISVILLSLFMITNGQAHHSFGPVGQLTNNPEIGESEPTPRYNTQMVREMIPVFCGDTGYAFDTSTMLGEKQILVGEIKTNGSPESEVRGFLSFGHNSDNNTGTFFITIPDGGINYESITCVLGYGMNWKFFSKDGFEINFKSDFVQSDITQD